jgi:hypothetical protein
MPSDYLSEYRDRVSKSSLTEHTKQAFVKMFIGNPNYRVLNINGTQYETLYSQGKNSNEKSLLFVPNTKVDIGSVVDLNSHHYIIMDFQGEGINEIYPSATLKLCNSTYPIKLNKTSNMVWGYNQLGKPMRVETYEIDRLEPCIVEIGNSTANTESQLVIPKNNMYITIKYQQSDTIQIDYEFAMYNNKYKITDIDYTKVIADKGIIKILAERV